MNGIDGYRIEAPLSSNEKTIIYKAERESDGSRVILKTLAPGHNSQDELDRYRHEYALLRQLGASNHICPAIALEESHGRPVLVLADRDGVTLEALLGHPLDIETFLRLGIYMAEALADIHAHGIVHKDIKPSNILIGDSPDHTGGQAYLIDFAIASSLPVEPGKVRPPRFIQGTLPYISPEQTGRMNCGIDYRTDLYSMGVTMYRMLTGKLPFHGQDPLEWCHAHMAKIPTPPHELRPAVPRQIGDIVVALLAKVPAERYQSAAGLSRDLHRCLDAIVAGREIPRFALARREGPIRFRIPTKLYGRERELDTLFSSYRELLDDGASQLILVSGYSGIGKSSLVNELHKPLCAARGELASGKCEQYKRTVPYHALVQAFQEFCRHILGDEDEVVATWRQRILEAVGNNGRVLTDVLPDLAAIVGEQEPVPELGPSESQNRFNLVFRRFLRAIARPERPLVLFLDDMQWADNATIQLLQTILTDSTIGYLLCVLAYRDNEVSAAHPLMVTLDNLQKQGIIPRKIHLKALDIDSLCAMIADTLEVDTETNDVRHLATLVHAKTSGNPFYVIQFLTSLHRDGVLVRDRDNGRISCDLARVEEMAYTENVIDYMIGRLELLDEKTREAVQIAACCGNQFTFADVCLASGATVAAMREALWPAVREELLVPLSDRYRLLADLDGDTDSLPAVRYRFQHDRIQQAAYSMLSDDDRAAVHLRIGRRWRDHASEHTMDERIFDITDQLNQSIDLLDSDEERLQLAQLDLRAGRKAKAATAFDTATSLFSTAALLLPDDAWTVHYPLAFAVHREYAECEYLIGRFADSEQRFIQLVERARSAADKAEIYILRSRLYQLSGKYAACLKIASEALALFGIEVPEDPAVLDREIEQGFAELVRELDSRDIASLLDAPVLDDPALCAIIDLTVAAIPSAYLGAPQYFAWYANLGLGTALRHGNTPSSCYNYSAYAFLLVSVFNRPKLAWELSAMALELNDRFGNKALRGTLLHLHGDHFNYFGKPLASNFAYLDRAFMACQEVGDLVYAGFIAFLMVWWFIERGDPLHDVIAQAQRYAAFASETNNAPIQQTIELELQFVACLQGKTRSLASLDGRGFDESVFEAAQIRAGFGAGPAFLHIIKQMLHYVAGHYQDSIHSSRSAREVLGAVSAMPMEVHHYVFQALAAAALYPDAQGREQKEYRDIVEAAARRLAVLAENCPENFADRHFLVQAALARIDGDSSGALRAYEQAAQAARAQGFVHMEALAHLSAGRFYLAHGLDTAAGACLNAAYQCYASWGAYGMASELERLYPLLIRAVPLTTGPANTTTTVFDLDFQTIIKATRAISSEIQMNTLSERLLAIATESAGADHGYLVLDIDRERRIIDMNADTHAVDDVTDIARTVIDEVMHTGQMLVLDNATTDSVYGRDPHIARNQVKSLLCLPIELKGDVTGVLYLENRLIAGSFTPERLAVLGVVATQAAISLENAVLYQEMEQRVDERTRELHDAQQKLMVTAHQAGMAEIASSVLHNVGNILNSLNVSVNVLYDQLRALRLPVFERSVDMLEAHHDDLATFLIDDEKGRQLPALLRGLCDHLLDREKHLNAEIKRLEQHIHHLDAIVHMQQRYADPSRRLVEQCTIRDLVDDALGFNAASLKQYNIKIEKHYHDTRPCDIEKHRILQILVNLIANAKHAMISMPMEHPRRLTITVVQDRTHTHVMVEDTGKGMAPDDMSKLFKFGFTTRPGGHGLGLHSSAINAQAVGGWIDAHSEGPGLGARFTLSIPLRPAQA